MTAILAALVLATQTPAYAPTGPRIQFTMASGKAFVITTDPKSSPKTVAHILELVKKGFYNRQRVHRVEPWVTQWGDPLSKTAPMTDKMMGEGGSGKDVPFEECLVDYTRGVVGVASTGLQVGGDSQLFVLKKDALRLFRSYAVVGLVTKGMDVVDGIKKGDRIRTASVLKN